MIKKKLWPIKNLNNPQVQSYQSALRQGADSQHIVPAKNGWAVIRSSASRASKIFDTQKRAVSYGERVARNNHADLFIHKSNGRIKSRKSYRK